MRYGEAWLGARGYSYKSRGFFPFSCIAWSVESPSVLSACMPEAREHKQGLGWLGNWWASAPPRSRKIISVAFTTS